MATPTGEIPAVTVSSSLAEWAARFGRACGVRLGITRTESAAIPGKRRFHSSGSLDSSYFGGQYQANLSSVAQAPHHVRSA